MGILSGERLILFRQHRVEDPILFFGRQVPHPFQDPIDRAIPSNSVSAHTVDATVLLTNGQFGQPEIQIRVERNVQLAFGHGFPPFHSQLFNKVSFVTIYKKIKKANQYLLDVHDKSSNLNLYEFGFALMHEGDRMAKTATDNNLKSISSRIEVELYRDVKIASVRLDKPMADVIREALELWLTTVTSDGTPAGA